MQNRTKTATYRRLAVDQLTNEAKSNSMAAIDYGTATKASDGGGVEDTRKILEKYAILHGVKSPNVKRNKKSAKRRDGSKVLYSTES